MKIHQDNILSVFLKRLSLFLCASMVLLTLPFSLHAQSPKTWEWVRTFGSRGWDISGGAAADAQNNIYVAGTFTDTLWYEKTSYPSQGQTDMFIARITGSGTLEKCWTVGGTGADHASCLTVTSGGNIIISGSITGLVSFGTLSIDTRKQVLFVASMDKKGNFSWATPVTPTGRASFSYIGSDTLGYVYACGQFTDTLTIGSQTLTSNGKTDVFIIKLDNTGTPQKVISFGSADEDSPSSLAVSSSGEVTCSGNFSKTFTIHSLTLSAAAKQKSNNFVIRFDTTLQASWGIIPVSDEYSKIAAIRYGKHNNTLYIAGSFSASLTLADTTLSSHGLTDGFLARLDSQGKVLWARNIGSPRYDYIAHLNTDNLGGTLLTGSIGDTLTLDTLSVVPPTRGNTAFAAQFDTTGHATWADYLSGSGRNFGETTVLDTKGNLYIYGAFTRRFEKESDTYLSKGDQDIFLARYYNCPDTRAEIIGNRYFCPGSGTELSVRSGYTGVVWNDTLGSRFFYTQAAGSYWVSMYDKKGCLYTDTVEITQAPLPVFSLGADTSLLVTDSLVVTAPARYTNYYWQDYTNAPQYQVTAPGGKPGKQTIWLHVTDTLGCSFTDTLTVTFTSPGSQGTYSGIKLYTWPNPVGETLYWRIDTETTYGLYLEISDNYGRVLSSQSISGYTSGASMQVDVSRFPQGTYIFNVKTHNGETITSQGFVKR